MSFAQDAAVKKSQEVVKQMLEKPVEFSFIIETIIVIFIFIGIGIYLVKKGEKR